MRGSFGCRGGRASEQRAASQDVAKRNITADLGLVFNSDK